jgi:hypothetical protein
VELLNSIKSALHKLRQFDQLVLERDNYRAQLERFDALVVERDNLRGKLEQVDKLVAERDRYRAQLEQLYVPPGHFASPFPCLEEIRRDEARIFGELPTAIQAVDLHAQEQLQLLNEFIPHYRELPFGPVKTDGLRYYYDNPAFSYCDAIILHCMIRTMKPKKIIEVGSGFSSCVTLDTNELFFAGEIDITFIEPYTKLLLSLITEEDQRKVRTIPSRLQDVALGEFEALRANDILFIDSTHVSKIDSDVNYLFFEILPRLAQGVLVHIHDIPYPFEYRKAWVYEGRAWNEAYLLRAFLQYNCAYRIVFMNSYMTRFHNTFFRENMPLCLKKRGASIWIRRE